jgi:thiamine pyrophosphate-dependent acetolactate synthase large subunit-like protein
MAPSLFSQVDFGAVARAMGAAGTQVTNLEDFEAQFYQGLMSGRPYVVDAISSINASPIISLGQVGKGAYA